MNREATLLNKHPQVLLRSHHRENLPILRSLVRKGRFQHLPARPRFDGRSELFEAFRLIQTMWLQNPDHGVLPTAATTSPPPWFHALFASMPTGTRRSFTIRGKPGWISLATKSYAGSQHEMPTVFQHDRFSSFPVFPLTCNPWPGAHGCQRPARTKRPCWPSAALDTHALPPGPCGCFRGKQLGKETLWLPNPL